jgi:hypothetical protein
MIGTSGKGMLGKVLLLTKPLKEKVGSVLAGERRSLWHRRCRGPSGIPSPTREIPQHLRIHVIPYPIPERTMTKVSCHTLQPRLALPSLERGRDRRGKHPKGVWYEVSKAHCGRGKKTLCSWPTRCRSGSRTPFGTGNRPTVAHTACHAQWATHGHTRRGTPRPL